MPKEPQLWEIYQFPQIYPYKEMPSEFEKDYKANTKEQTERMVNLDTLVGIEIEVENIRSLMELHLFWQMKNDGSLRNNGKEFVSIPLKPHQIPYALQYLQTQIEYKNQPKYTSRTSVHIHLNVRDMTKNEIKIMVLLYALFERHFFNFVGTVRETSIFCVPLYRSRQLHSLLSTNLTTLCTEWHKYNALNCGTILGNDNVGNFGTIEFRHLYGTANREIICNWINQILLLKVAAKTITLKNLIEEIKTLNTTSEYAALYKNIFGEYAQMNTMTKNDFEYCVTMTKLALFGEDYEKTLNYYLPESNYYRNYAKRHSIKAHLYAKQMYLN